ncbi:hypothetical protein ABIA14_006568 [Sinorhizobium fredii]
MTAVCKTLGVARSNMAERAKQIPSKARGRPPLADWGLVEEIKAIIADMPTCGYRRVPTNEGRAWPNAKRVYRVMRLHGLLFQRHTGIDTRRHDGRVVVEVSNLRWCSVRIPVKSAADSETKPAAYSDRTGYRHCRSDPAIYRDCPLLAACTSNAAATNPYVWADARERTDANRLTSWGKAIYKRRKETVERSFADAKQLHGHRCARFRSQTRVACQCLPAAAAQNIKKIAMVLTRAPKSCLSKRHARRDDTYKPPQSTRQRKPQNKKPAENIDGFVSSLSPPLRRRAILQFSIMHEHAGSADCPKGPRPTRRQRTLQGPRGSAFMFAAN